MADEDKVDGAAEGGKKSGLMKILVFVFAGIILVGASVAVTLYMT
jgi:flagellar basal body-associated protein FliL